MLLRNLAVYRDLYPGIEIIVVDDGCGDLPELPEKVIKLPSKSYALNPCSVFNRGVDQAIGDIIVLTNPEVVHRASILEDMRQQLSALGPNGYVAAACWSEKEKWWFCHSSLMKSDDQVGRAKSPKGAGLHFCSMLYRSFYDEVGGFSEEYRFGQGYEDNDFLWKLNDAGASFMICDNLITDHIDCLRTEWPVGGAKRNKEIFERKWNV